MYWFEALLVTLLVSGFYLHQARIAPFHPDEANRIATSDAFEAFFSGRFKATLWRESYWTLTQPPVSRYWTGLGRWLGGYRPSDLKNLWAKQEPYGTINRFSAGNVTPRMLWWSRMPITMLSALAVFIVFFLCFRVAGRLAGYLVIFLFLGSSYFSQLFPRAMGEAPLLAAILIAWFAGYQAIRYWEQACWESTPAHRRSMIWSLLWFGLMGLFCGIAGASKLNGASITLAALLLVVATPLIRKGILRKAYRLRFMLLSGCLLAFSTAMGFITPNPYLYPDILGRATRMLNNRFVEMQDQLQENPGDRFSTPSDRISAIAHCALQDCTAMRFSGSLLINLAFCLLGAAYLIVLTWKWFGGQKSPVIDSIAASVVTALIGVTASIPVLGTPLNWSRYYMLPTVFTTICIAIGIAWIVKSLLTRLSSQPKTPSIEI